MPGEGGTSIARTAEGWARRRANEFAVAQQADLIGRIDLCSADEIVASGGRTDRNKAANVGLRGFSWAASWRDGQRGVIHGHPPFYYDEAGQKVRNPKSTFPKPWGWFDPDHGAGEVGFVWVEGPDDAWRRFTDRAGASWRDLVSTELPALVAGMVDRCKLVQLTDGEGIEDCKRWIMFLFLVTWSRLGPPSLLAERWRWIPGTRSRIAADAPDPGEIIRDAAERMPFAEMGVDPTRTPKLWKHFEAKLSPNLVTASSEVLVWLDGIVSPDARIASVTARDEPQPGAHHGSARRGANGPRYRPSDKILAVEVARQYRQAEIAWRGRDGHEAPTDEELFEVWRALPPDERSGKVHTKSKWLRLCSIARSLGELRSKRARIVKPDQSDQSEHPEQI